MDGVLVCGVIAWMMCLFEWRASVGCVLACVAYMACLDGWRASVGSMGDVLSLNVYS